MEDRPHNSPGQRSFYVDDHVDEGHVPASTLPEWATYLAAWQDSDTGEAYPDGASFRASAILWHADIIATRTPEGWLIDREPDDGDFVAVRYAEGMGWPPDNIFYPDMAFDAATGEYGETESMADALRRWLAENDAYLEDVEHVAHGKHESGWKLTLHRTDPPTVTSERTN